MRILMLCRSMPWHLAGGMEKHAWDLLRGLADAGDEVHLLTTPSAAQSPPSSAPHEAQIHTIRAGVPGRYSMGAFLAFAREASLLHREFRFDAIHSQGFAAYLLSRSLAPRLAVTIHGTLTSETVLGMPGFAQRPLAQKAAELWRMKGRLASAPLYSRLLRRARVILVDSKFTRSELIRARPRLADKIVVAPLGIHPERIPMERPQRLTERPVRFLSVGRLTAAKGFHVVLEALARLPREGWRWRLAGTGSQALHLSAMAERAGISDRVEFLGTVDEERLRRLYRESDIFIYPELAQPAFGLVALEALLAGLPVVASDRGAIPEVVRPDCGWLFPAGDAEALGRRLSEIVEHPAMLHEKALGCRSISLERFSYSSMTRITREALQRCAGTA